MKKAAMVKLPYIADAGQAATAADLLARLGRTAAAEAAARAGRSRALGNYLHFCRWRQIERLIGLLSSDRADGTIH